MNLRRHLDRCARAAREARANAILAKARRVGYLNSDDWTISWTHEFWCQDHNRPFVQINKSTIYMSTYCCSWLISRHDWEALVVAFPWKTRRDDEEFFVLGVPERDREGVAWRLLEMALDCRPVALIEG